MRSAVLATICALALCPAVAAQAPAAPDIGWFHGRWQGTGTSFGRPGKASLGVQPVLGGKFMELSYKVVFGGDRPTTFEGKALYRASAPGRMDAHWFDSRGESFPIRATLSPSALTSDWGAAGKEQGRTIYRLRDDQKLEVVDMVTGKAGAPSEFARYIYVRAQ